jgi:hypothetical protein
LPPGNWEVAIKQKGVTFKSMKSCFWVLAALAIWAGGFAARGGNILMQSGPGQVTLMELYTSEGCSSCPPAEAWFSQLKNAPGLWKTFVPVAFHVNYWDNLGWTDKYASAAFTARQRSYAAEWRSESVYTPELVNGGKEGSVRSLPKISNKEAGALQASLNEQRELSVRYMPATAGKHWQAHVALLVFDLDTAVKAGENSGRTLRHDFIVLTLQSNQLKSEETKIMLAPARPQEKGIAVWVAEAGRLTPVQATGAWLK